MIGSADEPVGRNWCDRSSLSVLGMGRSLPGDPIDTEELLARVRRNFNIDVQAADPPSPDA
jgi:hypothetical protein